MYLEHIRHFKLLWECSSCLFLLANYIPSPKCACRKKLVVKPRPHPTPAFQPQAQRKPVGFSSAATCTFLHTHFTVLWCVVCGLVWGEVLCCGNYVVFYNDVAAAVPLQVSSALEAKKRELQERERKQRLQIQAQVGEPKPKVSVVCVGNSITIP